MCRRGRPDFSARSSRDLIVDANFIQNHGYHLESGYVQANQPSLSAYTALVQAGQQYALSRSQASPDLAGLRWRRSQMLPHDLRAALFCRLAAR
jgi:hypothetical protein